VANQPTTLLLINVSRLLQVCPSPCAHHTRLIRNLLSVMAQKTLNLSRHIQHTAPKGIRGRLVAYLSFLATRQGRVVTVPFNRQQLADYLGVDRSALCHEISKMQKEGLLRVEKNSFTLSGG
ncbi:MAG: Crp/Fnr family transcriptional regulator, partial [Gemmiger sp.]|nr:Crp/Fnr family transcriptional regulator [Gemmiger sp.]